MAIVLVILFGLWAIIKVRSLRGDLRFLNERFNSLQRQLAELQKKIGEREVEVVQQRVPAPELEPEPELELEPTPDFEPEPEPFKPTVAPRPQTPRPSPSPVFVHDAGDRARQIFDLEETLGANWLLKIGMAILVVGISLFLGYSVQRLGPMGKIATATALSAAGIVGGRAMERRPRYRTFGRVLLSGGWALAYFTAYAMRYIDATRVLDSDIAGVFVMLAVAAGMVAQSLKYRSQFVTGFAYGLAYLTLTMHHLEWRTLIAGFVLSISIVVILRKLNWFALESFAVAGAYANHVVWVHSRIGTEPNGQAFPEYAWSAVLLAAYWTLFTVSHFLRRSRTDSQDRWALLAVVLNAAGYVGVSGYQSVHPEMAFSFFLALGIVYLALSYVSQKLKRRSSFLLMSTIGAGLAIAAIPYKYSGNTLAIVWLLECAILLITGYRLAEIQFRRIAWGASAILCVYLLLFMIGPALGESSLRSVNDGRTLALIGLAFIAGALVLPRRYAAIANGDESITFTAYLYAGWLLSIVAAWFLVSPVWLALVWMSLGFVFFGSHLWFGNRELRSQAQILMLLGALRAVIVNMGWDMPIFGIPQRVVTCGAAAILLYIYGELTRRNSAARGFADVEEWTNAPAGTLILALLAWYSFSINSVALAWAVLALALLETGRMTSRNALRWQGHVMGAAVFVRIFVANMNDTEQFGLISMRLITVLPLAAMFYYLAYELQRDAVAHKLSPLESDVRTPAVYSYFGLAALVGLLRFEVTSAWVAVAWAAIVMLLVLAFRLLRFAPFQVQSVVVSLLVVARASFENLYNAGPQEGWLSERAIVIGATALAFLAAYLISVGAKGQRGQGTEGAFGRLIAQSHHVFFFSAVGLITALIWLENADRGYLTSAWALEAVIIFTVAVLFDERAYRLFGLSLLLVCTAKVILLDVWRLETLQRILAFIVLGAALVLVSFFYTRYRESWRKVLLGS